MNKPPNGRQDESVRRRDDRHIPAAVLRMIRQDGLWLVKDTLMPNALIPIVSMNGTLHAITVDDKPLDPNGWCDRLITLGPFK